MENEHNLLNFLLEYWQVIFLYAFKFLNDLDNKLDDIKLEQARQDERIKSIYHNMEKRTTFNEQ